LKARIQLNTTTIATQKLPDEKPIQLRARLFFVVWFFTLLISFACCFVPALFDLWKFEVSISAAFGTILIAIIMLAGLFALAPWATRTPSSWGTRWLASTVLRFICTPFLALLLYSRPPSAEAFLLSVAATYLFMLAAETAVLAKSVLATVASSTALGACTRSPTDSPDLS